MLDKGYILYILGLLMGVAIGILIPIAAIDDLNTFHIPMTDKVFIRYVPEVEKSGEIK